MLETVSVGLRVLYLKMLMNPVWSSGVLFCVPQVRELLAGDERANVTQVEQQVLEVWDQIYDKWFSKVTHTSHPFHSPQTPQPPTPTTTMGDRPHSPSSTPYPAKVIFSVHHQFRVFNMIFPPPLPCQSSIHYPSCQCVLVPEEEGPVSCRILV